MTYDPNNPNNPYGQVVGGQPAGQVAQPGVNPQIPPGTPYPGYVTQPQVQPPAMRQATQPMAMPQYHPVNEEQLQQAYAQHRTEMSNRSGDGPQYITFPGPQGQKRWDSTVHPGHKAKIVVYIANPWAPGANIFYPTRSHFWKSQTKPQGQSINCPGPDTCLICRAKEAAMNQPNAVLRERAKDVGRVRTRFLYNVYMLENPMAHYDGQGIMKPFILAAGAVLHSAIGDLIDDRGAMRVVDPQQGTPVTLTKKKTGPRELDVEYGLVPKEAMPLPAEFYPAMGNLWDLSAMDRIPTEADMMTAVTDMGLPMPGSAPVMGHSAPMSPPNPAYGNPFPQQAQPAYVPPTPSQTGPPPNMTPPAVQSTPIPNQYSPQPSQMPVLQATPQQPVRQSVQQAQEGAGMLAQLEARSSRVDGRDKCFGKYDGASNFCKECPPDLQPQCVAQSVPAIEQPQIPAATGQQTVEQLQAQLQGK